jgi:phosphoribosylformylglycinamidine synthase
MAQPSVLILRAPGTNCDRETAFAFERAGGRCDLVHVNRLLEEPNLTEDYQIFCLPGGFSYGDDIAAGRILATQVRHHLSDAMERFREAGKLILGICNGFQVLIQTGMLVPPGDDGHIPVTLTANDSGRFEDRWVRLDVSAGNCVFLRDVQRMDLPVAHAEGKFVYRDELTCERLRDAGQLVLRYAVAEGRDQNSAPHTARAGGPVPYPDNPNGSLGDVAGLSDLTGRVLGLMPHPERHIDPTHHPQWTRRPPSEGGEGLVVFENAVRYFE